MPCVVYTPKPSVTTYAVNGDTLEALWADIEKRGPRDTNDGKRVASLTRTDIVVEDDWEPHVHAAEVITRGGQQTHVLTISVEDMRVTVTGSITMPKLGKAALSKAARKEWDRFVGEVEKHELGHVAAAKAVAEGICNEARKMRVTGEASSHDEALKKARAALEKDFEKVGGPAAMDKLLLAAHVKYDSSTGHGPKLNAAIL